MHIQDSHQAPFTEITLQPASKKYRNFNAIPSSWLSNEYYERQRVLRAKQKFQKDVPLFSLFFLFKEEVFKVSKTDCTDIFPKDVALGIHCPASGPLPALFPVIKILVLLWALGVAHRQLGGQQSVNRQKQMLNVRQRPRQCEAGSYLGRQCRVWNSTVWSSWELEFDLDCSLSFIKWQWRVFPRLSNFTCFLPLVPPTPNSQTPNSSGNAFLLRLTSHGPGSVSAPNHESNPSYWRKRRQSTWNVLHYVPPKFICWIKIWIWRTTNQVQNEYKKD